MRPFFLSVNMPTDDVAQIPYRIRKLKEAIGCNDTDSSVEVLIGPFERDEEGLTDSGGSAECFLQNAIDFAEKAPGGTDAIKFGDMDLVYESQYGYIAGEPVLARDAEIDRDIESLQDLDRDLALQIAALRSELPYAKRVQCLSLFLASVATVLSVALSFAFYCLFWG